MVDESDTCPANFFGPDRFESALIRPRPPAFSRGFTSFVWGVLLGGFIWVGLLAIGVSGATAFLFGALSAALIFFFVRLYGDDQFRR